MQSGSDAELLERITKLSLLFDDLCQQSHIKGEVDEGTLHFLNDDKLETLLHELVAIANNARYAFINLALAQDYLETTTPLGKKGFTPAKRHWKGDEDETGPDSTA